MKGSANLLAIQALEDMKAGFAQFRSESQEALLHAEWRIQKAIEWLAERQAYWTHEIRRCEEEVLRAKSALSACQASGYHNPRTGQYYPPDCSRYEEHLLQTQVNLRRAEDGHKNVQDWMRLVERSVADYEKVVRRLNVWLGDDLCKALSVLERSAVILYSYTATSTPMDVDGAFSRGIPVKSMPTANPHNSGGSPELPSRPEREPSPESTEGSTGGPERG